VDNHVSFDIPENLTYNEKIAFMYERLNSISTPYAKRLQLMRILNSTIMLKDNIDENDRKNAIVGYKKVFASQLEDKHVAVHKEVFNILITMAKHQTSIFSPDVPYYVKRLLGHVKHTDIKSVEIAEKCLNDVIQIIPEKGPMTAELIKESNAKNKAIIRRNAWKFLDIVLQTFITPKQDDKKSEEKNEERKKVQSQ